MEEVLFTATKIQYGLSTFVMLDCSFERRTIIGILINVDNSLSGHQWEL
jgi:hypothetical protein